VRECESDIAAAAHAAMGDQRPSNPQFAEAPHIYPSRPIPSPLSLGIQILIILILTINDFG